MTTPSSYPYMKASEILASVVRVIGIGKISAADPFPTVAGKIQNPIGTCAFG
jgi:hypothetical protein